MTPSPGDELPTIEQRATLATAVRYAGASGDLNPLHYDDDVARTVSPTGGVIAHGMYAVGLASRALTAWAGDPGRIEHVSVRFTRPWRLGTLATFGGRVRDVTDGIAIVALWGRDEEGSPIVRGRARVRVG